MLKRNRAVVWLVGISSSGGQVIGSAMIQITLVFSLTLDL